MIVMDLSKQQELDADPKAMQPINFTGYLDQAWNTIMFFITEKAKVTILDLLQGTINALYLYFPSIEFWSKMTKYNTLNVTLTNLQLSQLKSGMKNGTQVTSNVVGDFNDATNFSYKSLLINSLVSRLWKAITNGSSSDIKLSKTQLSKMEHFLFVCSKFNHSNKWQYYSWN